MEYMIFGQMVDVRIILVFPGMICSLSNSSRVAFLGKVFVDKMMRIFPSYSQLRF